jgi:O-antigen/teichoic acid export membrane protein
LIIGFVVYVLPDSIGEQLLGENWIPAHQVIIPSAIALALSGLMTGMFLQMRVAQAVKETLALRVAMLVAAVVLATLGAVFWDAKGAAWGLVIATAGFTWLSWRQARKVFARREEEAAAALAT